MKRTAYHTAFPDLGDELDQAWRTWCQRHSLPDVHDITANSEIVCDDDLRTVTVECFVRDREGRCIVIGCGHDRGQGVYICNCVDPIEPTPYLITEYVTVQLEAPALPFPDGGIQDRIE